MTAFVMNSVFSRFILDAFTCFVTDLLVGSMDEEKIGSVVTAHFQ